MALTRKDAAATLLAALVVLTFAANHQGWDVWLVGDSRRWAAGAIALLGVFMCGLGSPGKGAATRLLSLLGILAAVLTGLALATASLTLLSLLVADILVLWLVATLRHAGAGAARPIPH